MSERPKILVARVGAIGDVCMLMPVVRALARSYEVHWLIHSAHAPIIECFPEVTCRPIGVTAAPGEDQPFPSQLVAMLRAQGHRALIDFSHWPSINCLARQLGDIPVRAVTHDPPQDALLGIPHDPEKARAAFNLVVPVPDGVHQLDKWRLLVREACGIDLELDWPLPALRGVPADRPLRVFLHPHAGKPEKVWPARRFAGVLAGLARSRKVQCIINNARRATTRELHWRLFFSGIRSEAVPLDPSFRRLREALCRSDVAIGCDSGPMHFAALLGVPTVLVYGRYPASEFAPLWRSRAVSPPSPGMDADAVSADQVSAALATLFDHLPAATGV